MGWCHQSPWRHPFSSHPFRSLFQRVLPSGSRNEGGATTGLAHMFVIYGHQGAESDPEKLTLSDNLLAAVLAEAKVCCAGQPVILVADLNADPTVIPSLAKGFVNGTGRGVAPARTCQFQLDEGSRRDFTLACLIAMAATTACRVLPDWWFTPHHAILTEFSLSAWDANVHMARVYSPLWPACWVDCPDRSRRSPSPAVQNVWDVYFQEVSFLPPEVREPLFIACVFFDVDVSWRLWSREAEACFARAYLTAGGPAILSPGSYVGGANSPYAPSGLEADVETVSTA